MKDINYTKRKLGPNYGLFMSVFGEQYITYLRQGYKLAILNNYLGYGRDGDLCLVKRHKEYVEDVDSNGRILSSGWTGQFEWTHITTDGKYANISNSYVLQADIIFKTEEV